MTGSRAAAIAAFLLVFVLAAGATTVGRVDLRCPVCGKDFAATVLHSSNNFGGSDRDLLQYASGTQPILLYPKSCPRCLYSGMEEADFEAEIGDVTKKQILEGHVLQAPPDAPADRNELPAWARYDLAAQTYRMLGRQNSLVGSLYLRASWAVRLTADPLETLSAGERQSVDKWAESAMKAWREKRSGGEGAEQHENAAMLQLAFARHAAAAAARASGDERRNALLAALDSLRRHGENTEAKALRPALQRALDPDAFAALDKSLEESIARERRYQEKALAALSEGLKEENDATEKAVVTYVCGELQRRLERFTEARGLYAEAAKMEHSPEFVQQYSREQATLLPKKK